MVFCLIYIANNVVVANSVFARAEVPGFFFRVVWSVLEPL